VLDEDAVRLYERDAGPGAFACALAEAVVL
jgi:hypothetical protein